ncbi:hypothetical protein EC991_002943 [Linnemannia zychae]|nr:hypothetical protein EC991_002943 [Linnemannia zychae]
MLHNNKAALLQRRGDPNSPTCKQAEANGRDSMDTLTAAIQDYDDPAVALTQKFQNALFKAYDNRNDAALAAIEDAYSKAKAAANNASGPQAQSLRDALDDMISKARIAGDACKV